jgi:putative ABC transport system substrate-binding protein
VTGVTNLTADLGSKQLGLLRELVPRTSTIAALMNPNFAGTEKLLRDVEAAARVLGLQLIVLRAGTEEQMETAFATIPLQGAGALLVGIDAFFAAHSDRIIALAARDKLPAIYGLRDFVVSGGLMSYGTNFADSYRQAGIYTGRILRGEKPADLPVQQSTKFEFIINFKTAKALGIEVPNSMQLLANEVIE